MHDERVGNTLQDTTRVALGSLGFRGPLSELFSGSLELLLHRLRFLELLGELLTLLVELLGKPGVIGSGLCDAASHFAYLRECPCRGTGNGEKSDHVHQLVQRSRAEVESRRENEELDEQYGSQRSQHCRTKSAKPGSGKNCRPEKQEDASLQPWRGQHCQEERCDREPERDRITRESASARQSRYLGDQPSIQGRASGGLLCGVGHPL